MVCLEHVDAYVVGLRGTTTFSRLAACLWQVRYIPSYLRSESRLFQFFNEMCVQNRRVEDLCVVSWLIV